MHTLYYIILALSVALFASVLTLGAYLLFGKLGWVAQVEDRSNHQRPVVTGVGVGFMIAILGFLAVVYAPSALLVGGVLLLIVSMMDDRKPLSAAKRFGFQAIAVILALHVFEGQVFQGLLPQWLDSTVTALVWLWVMNLTNFMDGIDELCVIEMTSVMGGIVVLTLFFSVMPQPVEIDAFVIGVGVASFYLWNRHPARCFMGDAGSIPLGYLLGYVLLALCAAGQWAVALILPAYFLTDATLTLAKRLLCKEKIWQAHSKHYYQLAVRSGKSHAFVARRVGALNLVLIVLAALALYLPQQAWLAVLVAYVCALAVCFYFAGLSRRGQAVVIHEVAI